MQLSMITVRNAGIPTQAKCMFSRKQKETCKAGYNGIRGWEWDHSTSANAHGILQILSEDFLFSRCGYGCL